MKTTKQHTKFWKERKIDWEKDYLTGVINHPHRQLIIDTLARLQWRSMLEVGMGAGANLVRIKQQWPAAEVGGIDINRDAVIVAGKYLPNAKYLDVCDPRDIFLSNRSVDLILSDACLIYFGPLAVRKALKDMKRVGRNYLVLCELHSEKRQWFSRYNIHNYRKILDELDCYDIQIQKIPKDVWPGTPWEEFGHIITCQFIS